MPAAVWIPLAMGGAMAGAQMYGAKKGADVAKSAAATQSAATDKAAQLQFDLGNKSLDFQRDMWTQGRADMMPWMNTGKAALGALGAGMGLGSTTGQPPPGHATSTLGMLGQQGAPKPQLVWMQAPTGEKKQVPITMVEHYRRRGATQVQG